MTSFKMLNEEEKIEDEKVFAHHYISCSPGLSDIFNTFNTNDDDMVSIHIESVPSSPKLKSILKKTPNKSQIICSPSSAAIRRTKSQLCRRTLSARRELRFGPDTKKSPTISLISPKKKKQQRSFQLKKLFRCNYGSTTQEKMDNFITSTPINFLDDTDDLGCIMNKKKWHSPMRNNLPLFYGTEKYQCGNCKKTWETNSELISHTNNHHKGVRHWLRPQYRCGICSVKFYSNKYLVRHCHLQHTPTTKRRL